MKILLTGSSGFIGKYFIHNNSNKHIISTFSFLKDDINTIDLSTTDVVIHLGALVHQSEGAYNEEDYYRFNVDYTMQLAHKAKNSGVKQFVFLSSFKVYSDQKDQLYTEDSDCIPNDLYGKSKLQAEKFLMEINDETFLVSIIRAPGVYGEGMKEHVKLLNLIKLIDKIPILPFGNIKNKRNLVYVGNLTALIEKIITVKKFGIFVAADPVSFSTSELIEDISNALEKKRLLLYIPGFPTLLKILKPGIYDILYGNQDINNQKTKDILGFKEPFSHEQGINNMIKWYKSL